MQNDLAQDLLRGVVVAREIAHVELTDSDQDIREQERCQEDEDRDGDAVVSR
jgi:hypothetical protein